MLTNIRDLAEWYPFLPYIAGTPVSGTDMLAMLGIARHVLDMKLSIELPQINLEYHADTPGLYAVINSISSTVASVDIHVNDSTRAVEVPVYIGRDTIPESTSYVVLDEEIQEVYFTFVLNPACLSITQKASEIKFYDRTIANTDSGEYCSQQDPVNADELSFTNGHNARVDFLNDALVIDAGAGYGLGIYTDPPYNNVPTYNIEPSIGLRSLQGATEAEIYSEDAAIGVSTQVSGTDVTVSISHSQI